MKLSFVTLLFALLLGFAPQAGAQTRAAGREGQKERDPVDEDFALERRAEAEPKALVSLCLASGDVIVRGWERNEVRARAEARGPCGCSRRTCAPRRASRCSSPTRGTPT